MNGTDPFQSSRESVDWAKNHITNLESQAVAFFNTNPYSRIVEIDPNTAEKVHKVRLVKPLPVALSHIAFDAVNNLRSALDQAGFAAGILAKPGNPKYTNFPFADSAAQLEVVIKGRCKDIPQDVVNIMRGFKPYKGGNDLLWALNQLANTNKHAIVRPVATLVGGVRLVGPGSSIGGVAIGVTPWDSAKNELEFARSNPGGTFEMNVQVSSHIAICDIEFIGGKPAIAVLNDMASIVESIIMAIEAECRRIFHL